MTSRGVQTQLTEERLLTYEECKAWAEKYGSTPWSMLALSTAAAKDPGPMKVMRSLFALADAYLARERVKEAQMEYVGSLRIKIAAQERVIEALVRVLPAIERYAAQDHGDISGPSIAAFEDAVETLRAAVSVGSPETRETEE